MEQVKLQFPQEYSVYTQELLAKPPPWMLRWGGTVIFTIMLAMIAVSWLIKYPDIITAEATITTPVPPLAIIARQNGQIHWIKPPQDLAVKKGDTIAYIENPASSADISQLQLWLEAYKENDKELPVMPSILKLGEVQNNFSHFQKTLNEYHFFETLNPLAKKLSLAKQKQQQLHQLLEQHDRQKSILINEYELLNKNLHRFQKLQNRNLVAETKIDEIKITLLKNRQQQEQIQSDIVNTNLELTNLDSELVEFKMTDQQKLQDYKLKLAEAFQSLSSGISKWKKQYLLISPISGRLTFSKYWSEHQFVKADEEVVTVVPDNNQPIIAKVKMPLENSGKVKIGQKILIKLASYPYQEYGQIESRVDAISLVPRENMYTVETQLPNPLKTSFNKTLNFDQEMQGKADIVTEDMRLIERFFYQILKILKA